MTQTKNQIILYTLTKNDLYGYAMSTFLPIVVLEYIDPKELDTNKHTSNS